MVSHILSTVSINHAFQLFSASGQQFCHFWPLWNFNGYIGYFMSYFLFILFVSFLVDSCVWLLAHSQFVLYCWLRTSCPFSVCSLLLTQDFLSILSMFFTADSVYSIFKSLSWPCRNLMTSKNGWHPQVGWHVTSTTSSSSSSDGRKSFPSPSNITRRSHRISRQFYLNV